MLTGPAFSNNGICFIKLPSSFIYWQFIVLCAPLQFVKACESYT